MSVDEGRSQRRITILGPQRSGRTTALALIARQLTALGRPAALIATRRTSPMWLAGIRGLHLVPSTEGEQLRELRVRHPDLSVLVDDAEALDGSHAEAFVLEALHDLDRTGAWCVGAVESRRATSLYRGLVPDLTRHGTGVVLWPTSPTDGELLGARVEVTQHRVPGRGVLVVDGLATPLQLADPTPTADRLPLGQPASQPGPTHWPQVVHRTVTPFPREHSPAAPNVTSGSPDCRATADLTRSIRDPETSSPHHRPPRWLA